MHAWVSASLGGPQEEVGQASGAMCTISHAECHNVLWVCFVLTIMHSSRHSSSLELGRCRGGAGVGRAASRAEQSRAVAGRACTARCCRCSLRKGRGCVAARVDCRPSSADTSFLPASCTAPTASQRCRLVAQQAGSMALPCSSSLISGMHEPGAEGYTLTQWPQTCECQSESRHSATSKMQCGQ